MHEDRCGAVAAWQESDDVSCPLWGPEGDPIELDGSWLGIYDSAALEVSVPLREGLEPIHVPQFHGASAGADFKTSRFVWNAAVVLSRFLASEVLEPPLGGNAAALTTACCADLPSSTTLLRAVELGAGTGVCSAALVRNLNSACRASPSDAGVGIGRRSVEVLATDLPGSVTLIHDTLRRNGMDGGEVKVAPFDWQEFESYPDLGENRASEASLCLSAAHLVFGADLTYSDQLVALVFKVARHACGAGAAVLLAHEPRGTIAEFEGDLSAALADSGVEWTRLPKTPVTADPDFVSIYLLAKPDAPVLRRGGRLQRLRDFADCQR
mmetsp:Transcript_25842/g.72038  ORF Transcript_25842/g.72038 Transcript_25842/m.72038 type:complete len:325 (-) Transcript_25842:59-1033(-)